MDIVIATNNLGKVKEFQSLLAPYGYTVKSLKDFPEIEEVEETGTSFEENARKSLQFPLRKISGGAGNTKSRDKRIGKEIAGREQRRGRRRRVYPTNQAVRQLPRTDAGNVPATD